MSTFVSKCGIDCSVCPWGPYPRKEMTAEEFEQYRKKAKEILGFMPIKTPCVTCQTPDDDIPKTSKLPRKKCLIRQCVDKNVLANCAFCARFPCETLKETAGLWNRKSIEEKLGEKLSEEDYHSFVEPFEGLSRLSAIRSLLKPDEIREPAKISKSETGIISFPENLPEKESASFRAVYNLLVKIDASNLGLKNTDTFAERHKLENRKAHIMRFLWILANYGRFNESESCLIVDAETYQANRGKEKKLSIWSFVKDVVFNFLYEFGIRCKRIALKGVKDVDLTTGTGYLRKRGWKMSVSFDERIGGVAVLKSLQTYAKKLDNKYGSKAFAYFRNSNMNILIDK